MFIVFGGASYYAAGGGNDYLKALAELEDAKKFADEILGKERVFQYIDNENPQWDQTEVIDWVHVFSIKENKIVYHIREKPFAYNKGECLAIRDRIQ